jgi:hypothetical protein
MNNQLLVHGSLDWTRPWYASIETSARQIVDHSNWLRALNQQSAALGLTNHRGLPLHFVDQTSLPEGTSYEFFISTSGKVPTRNNLHDLFNALVWLSFPNIKRQLNALQAVQIAAAGIGKSRGSARDAATIFDENAAILVVSDTQQGHALIEALRNHQWQTVWLDQRRCFTQHAEVWLFGHALMAKLAAPYKGITAHAWVVTVTDEFFSLTHNARRECLDERVANDLVIRAATGLNTRCFTPLPVLGVPGWWQPQDREFYDDARVFRPRHDG